MPRSAPHRAVLLAPLARDEVVSGTASRQRAGGAGLYAAWALHGLGAEVVLHTPLAAGDRDLLEHLPPGVEVVVHPSRRTTRFRLELAPDRPNERVLRLLDAADPLDAGRIDAPAPGSLVLLGPLLPQDLGPDLLARLARFATPCVLGAQGLVRRVAADGLVELEGPSLPDFPPLRVLAADEAEWQVIPRELAGRAEEWIVTLGDRGARIRLANDPEPIAIPAAPLRGPAREAVGLGDTFLAVYAWKRAQGLDPREAGRRAAGAAASLLERGSPGGPQ